LLKLASVINWASQTNAISNRMARKMLNPRT
jgi:hypothetical protein